MTTEEIIRKCKLSLEVHYRNQFKSLILFGSTARTQASTESDIDLLVLLDQPFDYFKELRQIIDLLYPIQLESDRLISVKPVLEREFERGRIQLYRNARREGILI